MDVIRRSVDHVKESCARENFKVFLADYHRVNKPTADPLIHSGMNIRVFIPYKQPKITSVLLHGRSCPQGETDGYVVYHKSGTVLEFSIPPGKTKPLHFLTVACEPTEERLYGFTHKHWNLP